GIPCHRASPQGRRGLPRRRRLQGEDDAAAPRARPPQWPAAVGGHRRGRLQPRRRLRVADTEEEVEPHVRGDQAAGVIRRRGDRLRGGAQAEEDNRREGQGAAYLVHRRRGLRQRPLLREEDHLQDFHRAIGDLPGVCFQDRSPRLSSSFDCFDDQCYTM
ncbi:unnamed protein product, partial [Musa acuminata subsp. burmannicoides]